jgi:hypothetical protein
MNQLLERKDRLVIGLWGTVLISFIFTVLWLLLYRNNLGTMLVLSVFYLAALAWGVVRSFHTWRDLHQNGFGHPKRWLVLGVGLMYLIQFIGLGFVQVMGVLAVWWMYF